MRVKLNKLLLRIVIACAAILLATSQTASAGLVLGGAAGLNPMAALDHLIPGALPRYFPANVAIGLPEDGSIELPEGGEVSAAALFKLVGIDSFGRELSINAPPPRAAHISMPFVIVLGSFGKPIMAATDNLRDALSLTFPTQEGRREFLLSIAHVVPQSTSAELSAVAAVPEVSSLGAWSLLAATSGFVWFIRYRLCSTRLERAL